MTKEQEKQIAAFINLGYTRDEAIQEILDDDSGGLETEEVKILAQKAKQMGRQNAGNSGRTSAPRERKPNESKRLIITHLFNALQSIAETAIISNPERQVDFDYNGQHCSITLTIHRPPKGQKE